MKIFVKGRNADSQAPGGRLTKLSALRQDELPQSILPAKKGNTIAQFPITCFLHSFIAL